MSTIEEIIQHNSAEYQRHRTTRNRLVKTLQFQRNIHTFQTIPKHYCPPATLELTVPNPNPSQKFEAEYHRLFFKHLNEVITHNTISLELENARLKEVVNKTEKLLSTSNAPPEIISQSIQQFHSQNETEEENTTAAETRMQAIAESQKTPPATSRNEPNTKKRRINTEPNTRKMRKLRQHFLSQGHNHKPQS